MWRKVSITLAVWCVVAVAFIQGAKIRFFQHHQPSHFEKAELHNTVLVSDGSIRLAQQVKPLATLKVAHIWCLVEDSQGRLVAGTGNEGEIWRVEPDGGAQLVYKADDPQIFALLATPDGRLFAGTGPRGLVLEIAADGKARVLAKTGETYVWSLAYDAASDTLYAGTGPRGKILRIARTGQVELFYASKQEHIQALLLANNQLYAATAKRGLVYRFDLKTRQTTVLFEAPHSEIRTLCRTGEVLYAGTAVPLGKSGSASSTSSGTNASGIKENVVFAVLPDGTVREVFRDRVMVLGLTTLAPDRLVIATSGQGQLFELDLRQQVRSELVRLEHPQITALCRRRDGAVAFASSEPGRIFLLQRDYVAQGTLVSEVLDTKQISRFCRWRWTATTPPGTRISLALRTGNTAIPDETWSRWSEEITDPDQSVADLPVGRFVQYRLTLTTQTPSQTPIVHHFSLGYQNMNLAPEITSLEVPDIESQPIDPAKPEQSRKLRFKWTASDPNEDTLVFDIYFRKEGWPHWVELLRDVEKPELEWDVSTVPSGIYRLKVVASDRKDNAESEARSTERISAPFIVDNQPPQVSLRLEKWDAEQAWLEVQASDNLTRLTQASWSLDGGKWQTLFPTDGVFDSRSKKFRIRTGPLHSGTHVVVVRIYDAAGNIGTADLVFEK